MHVVPAAAPADLCPSDCDGADLDSGAGPWGAAAGWATSRAEASRADCWLERSSGKSSRSEWAIKASAKGFFDCLLDRQRSELIATPSPPTPTTRARRQPFSRLFRTYISRRKLVTGPRANCQLAPKAVSGRRRQPVGGPSGRIRCRQARGALPTGVLDGLSAPRRAAIRFINSVPSPEPSRPFGEPAPEPPEDRDAWLA